MTARRRSSALMTGAAAVLALAACTSGGATNGGDTPAPTDSAGSFNWRQFDGTSISVALNQHPLQEALQALIPQFEEKTGITVNAEVLPEAQYFDKVQLALSSGAGTYDVYMVSPLVDWSYIPAGWAEPLDEYISNAQLTDPEWGFDDFFPTLLDANRWTGENGGGVGEGGLYAVPMAAETYIMAYRKDVFEANGLGAPETWNDVAEACDALADAPDDVRGIIARGTRDDTTDTGFIAGLTTWGGKDFNADLTSAINEPVAVEFSEFWVDLMHTCGAPDWSNIQWYDMVERFNAGGYAMVFDADNFAPPNYELPESPVSGKVAYAPVPAGPNGEEAKTDLATWGLGMAASGDQKEASWLFIQWASSAEVMTQAAVDHQVFSPTRQSVWNDPDVVEVSGTWGDGTWREAVEFGLNGAAALRATPEPLYGQVYGMWSAALQDIYAGADAQTTLDDAAASIDALIEQAGIR